jgi:uncharacterized protein (TIGR02271 family)
MINSNDIGRIEGSTAYDSSGDKVGKVDQVYLDDQTNEPSWATITTGLFGTSQSFVPLQDATFDGNDLRFGHSKDQIKGAPRVDADAHLSQEEERELYRYYGLEASYDAYDNVGTTTGTTDTTLGTTGTAGTTGTTGTTTGTAGYADTGTTARTGDDASLTLSEEQVNVGTESREAGRARLRKYVTTETQTVNVPVSKEKLVVERNPVEGRSSTGTISDDGEQVEEITLREERAVVDKDVVDVEEVRVAKEQVTETEQVSEQVRKEHAEVDVEGDIDSGRGGLGR